MCGCKGHGHEVGSLTTKGRRALGAEEANMPKVSTSEALLACMQGEDGGVGVALCYVHTCQDCIRIGKFSFLIYDGMRS